MYLAAVTDPRVARRLLAGVKSSKTDRDDRIDLAALVAGGDTFVVLGEGGEPLAAYLVQACGEALWITAATGAASVCLVGVIDGAAARQARACGLSALCFRTERRGLVRKARRIGYQVTRRDGAEYFMRKTLQC